ncbi:MAG: hypothetical protein V3U88_12455 [Methylococcales bacterium]
MRILTNIDNRRKYILYLYLLIAFFILIGVTSYLKSDGSDTPNVVGKETGNRPMSAYQQTELNTLTSSLKNLVARLDKIEKQQQRLIHETKMTHSETQTQSAGYLKKPEFVGVSSSQEWMQNQDAIEQDSIDIIDSTLQQEQPNDDWKMQMDVQINTMLSGLKNSDTVIDEIDCRTTTCRIELAHPQGIGQAAFLDSISTSEAFSGEFYAQSTINNLGEEVTVVYLSKPENIMFVDE